MTNARFTTEHLEGLIAQLRLWLIGVAVWLAENTPFRDARDVDAELRFFRRGLAAACVLLAMKRAVRPMGVLDERPAPARPGFRRARPRSAFRAYTRMIASAATLRGRHAALQRAAEHADALVARMVQRLEAETPPLAHILVAAVRESAAAQAAPHADVNDSS